MRAVIWWALVAAMGMTACGGGNDPKEDTQDSVPTLDCQDHAIEDITIAVRDGVELAATVRKPTDEACQLPTVLVFTPYDKSNARELWLSDQGIDPLFDNRDYAVVLADWRGRYGSAGGAGNFVQNGEDGHDIVEWIAGQSFSDGNVGMFGTSAVGGVQFNVAELKPPHLRAIVPIFAAPMDAYEKWMPGGVLRKEYMDGIGVLFGSVNDFFRDHPTYDATWRWAEDLYSPESVEVPLLHVHGFFDLTAGHTLAGSDRLTQSAEKRLLIGEWHHFSSGGETDWGNEMSEQELLWWDEDRLIQTNALAFFDRHLRGVASEADDWALVRYQRSDNWLDAEAWPPPGTQELSLYLGDGTLQESVPASAEYNYPYDPEDPSPTVGGQTLLYSYTHGPDWQDEVVGRSDALVFVTEPLTEALDLAGPLSALLQVRTTGEDTHFAIRITDVYPDGRHLLLTDGIRRLALHESLETLADVVPGDLYTVPVDGTNPLAWRFEEGHRIGLILTSSNYSRFERASNTGTVIYEDAASPVVVTNTLVAGESVLHLTLGLPGEGLR